jgi:hypothetical protein
MSVPKKLGFLLSALLIAMLSMPVLAQNDNGGGGNGNGNNGGGGGGGRRNFDPAQFQQRRMQQLQQQLGASDDEFAAIQPKVEAVMALENDVNTRPRGMFGRGGRGGGFGGFGGPTTQPSAVQTAMQDLQTTLDDQNASPDTIKTKLQAVRDAKAKARQDLVVAQQDLKSVLTQRQEAVMVLNGYLD